MLDGSSGATGKKVRMPPPLSGPPDRLGTLRADVRFATPRRDVPFVADLPRAFDAILLCFHLAGPLGLRRDAFPVFGWSCAPRRATADRVARWPLVLRVSVPDGECIVVVGIVWSACAALRDSLLATHGTAWNQTCRRAASTRTRLLACRLRARARAKREQRAVAIGMACRGAAVARRRQRRAPAAPVR